MGVCLSGFACIYANKVLSLTIACSSSAMLEQHSSTRWSRLAQHVERVESCRDLTWRIKWNFQFWPIQISMATILYAPIAIKARDTFRFFGMQTFSIRFRRLSEVATQIRRAACVPESPESPRSFSTWDGKFDHQNINFWNYDAGFPGFSDNKNFVRSKECSMHAHWLQE